MIVNPVAYSADLLEKVSAYDALPPDQKTSDHWNRTDAGGDMSDVKSFVKNHYKVEQDYTCPYCQQRMEVQHNRAWDLEHIAPRVLQPQFMFSPQNLCISCLDCNGFKSDQPVLRIIPTNAFPVRSADYLLVHPHFDEYTTHIKIVDEQGYLPLSAKGVFTVGLCKLYRFAANETVYADVDIDEADLIIEVASAMKKSTSEGSRQRFRAVLQRLLDQGRAQN